MDSTDKKVKYSKSKEAAKNLRKSLFKEGKKKFEDIIIADASAFGGPERRLKDDLYIQGRSPEDFPGFDQAKRIRGGLKNGGSVTLKKGPTVDNKDFIKSEKENQQRMPRGIKKAFKGGGRAYGNNS